MASEEELPRPILQRLSGAGLDLTAPATRRIFTNRDLKFEAIGAIGFDMDYTLAIYRQAELDALSVELTVQKLIERGYPERLREIEADPEFTVRGLVVDRKLGNLLKVDRHGYVGRAFHGKRRMKRSERREIYRAHRVGQERERFAYVDTLFSLPEVTVYAELVDLIDEHPGLFEFGNGREPGAPSYMQAWNDVREAIDEAHRDDSLKSRIKADPGRFIRHDPDLAATLHKLRSAGKKLFLLTNSFYPYSNVVMNFLLSGQLSGYDSWKQFFDFVVVGAGKPGFFGRGQPFQEVDPVSAEHVGKPRESPQKGRVYEGGNLAGLQEALGLHADEVLYVGDHIYGDILKSKKSSGWRTVLVVDDLEHDLAVREAHDIALQEIKTLASLRNRLAEQLSAQRYLQRNLDRLTVDALVASGIEETAAREMLDTAITRARARYDRLRAHKDEIDETLDERRLSVGRAFNRYWGSVFAERYDSSLFGAQVENYACLYTSRVSNFLYVSPARRFHAPHGSLPHWTA